MKIYLHMTVKIIYYFYNYLKINKKNKVRIIIFLIIKFKFPILDRLPVNTAHETLYYIQRAIQQFSFIILTNSIDCKIIIFFLIK